MAKKKTKKPKTFEEAITLLSEAVRELENGSLSLDESLERYEHGIGYLKHCQKMLADAERKIEVLSGFDAEGNPTTVRFDEEDMSLEEKADKRSRRRTARPKSQTPEQAVQETTSDTDNPLGEPPQDDVDVDGTLF